MRAWKWIGGAASAVGLLALVNLALVSYPVHARLAKDERNKVVSVWAYYQYGLRPSVLVVDLRTVSDSAAQVDVLRALFQCAESLKDKEFEKVVLAYRGSARLTMDGKHFRKVGRDFETENPIYTMRTLPENIRKLDGTPAYGTWTGGWLGVVGKQMEDLSSFSRDWYLKDLAEVP